MKDYDFGSDSTIPFKVLADQIKGITDGSLDEEDFDLDVFAKSGMAEFFGKILSDELSKPSEPISEVELYEEIVDNYFLLIKELGIQSFRFFRFADYDDCRVVILDGKKYDLDGEFCHDDTDATGALCAIDCLMADLGEEDETVLKKVESMINVKNRK